MTHIMEEKQGTATCLWWLVVSVGSKRGRGKREDQLKTPLQFAQRAGEESGAADVDV